MKEIERERHFADAMDANSPGDAIFGMCMVLTLFVNEFNIKLKTSFLSSFCVEDVVVHRIFGSWVLFQVSTRTRRYGPCIRLKMRQVFHRGLEDCGLAFASVGRVMEDIKLKSSSLSSPCAKDFVVHRVFGSWVPFQVSTRTRRRGPCMRLKMRQSFLRGGDDRGLPSEVVCRLMEVVSNLCGLRIQNQSQVKFGLDNISDERRCFLRTDLKNVNNNLHRQDCGENELFV